MKKVKTKLVPVEIAEEDKPQEGETVSIVGRRGKIRVCGRHYFNAPGDIFLIEYTNAKKWPPWEWVKEDKMKRFKKRKLKKS